MRLAGGEHSQAPGVPVNIGISTPEPSTVGAPGSDSPSPWQSRAPTPTRKRSPELGAKQDAWAQTRGPDNAANYGANGRDNGCIAKGWQNFK